MIVKGHRRLAQPPTAMKIAITGAGGYIGSRLVDRALQEGHEVVALGRRPLHRRGVTDLAFELALPDVPALPLELTALIHLAVDNSGARAWPPDRDLQAVKALQAALPVGARMIFVSSQSARADAVSEYGRSKWAIEAEVARKGGVSVRPGLVYGGVGRGLYGRICNLVQGLPVLPRFIWPRPVTQPIHVDDLSEGLLRIARGEGLVGGPIELAQPAPMPFDCFLAAVARHRLSQRKLFIPVPLRLILPLAALAERLLARDLGAAQLAALAQTSAMDTSPHLVALSLSLRPLSQGLRLRSVARGEARRARLDEGRRLLAYLLAARPKPSLIIRYVRSLEAQAENALLHCHGSVVRSSFALALIDQQSDRPWQRQLQRRLALALRIAEASPQSFDRFIGEAAPRPQPLRAATAVGLAILQEAFVRASRPLAASAARRYLHLTPVVE